MNVQLTRRDAMRGLVGGAATAAAASLAKDTLAGEAGQSKLKGNIHHSVSRWCYRGISLEELCKACQRFGIESVELLKPQEWSTVKKYGLTCAMTSVGKGIAKGFNRLEYHDELVAGLEKVVPMAAEAGMPNLICMSGNRKGMDDEQGLENCAIGLKRIVGLCEKHKVNLCMELLNSKVNHPDYMCDHTDWGVELCKRVGSPRFKLLYDIYHMQIMEGDLIRTIRNNAEYIGHYHTGGNPGRHEIDETQEIYYPAVMRAILETGFDGFVGQEFVPASDDPLASLEKCVHICDV